MRVLYFSRDYTTHDHRILASLAAGGHETHYLRLERRGHQMEDRLLPPGVRQVLWPGGRSEVNWRDYPRLLRALRRVLREVQPDVLHAGPIQTVGLLAALSGFQPLVSMSWGSDLLVDADKSKTYQRITRYVLKRSQVVMGDCQPVREKAISFGVPDERIVTFPWGVDVERFAPGEDQAGLRERAGWQDDFVLLHLRTWEPIYGVDVFLRGFIRAAQHVPELRLFMAGNGSLAVKLRQMVVRGQVLDRVQFIGQVPQDKLPDYYRAADLYVSASHSDGSSVSLLEALASGLPVLVSDIPGNREWATPGVGWRFPDGDSEALAAQIIAAAEERQQLKALGAAARQTAEARANWSKNFEKMLAAYEIAIAAVKK